MRKKDMEQLRRMKAKGAKDETIMAFFRAMGYQESEIIDEVLKAKDEPLEEEKPEDREVGMIARVSSGPKQNRVAVYFIGLALLLLAGFIVYTINPEIILPGPPAPNRTWTILPEPKSCGPAEANLKIYNEEIIGMGLVEFHILENNATCVPPIDLDAGIGVHVSCPGEFEDGKPYTVLSNKTHPAGFICRYQ